MRLSRTLCLAVILLSALAFLAFCKSSPATPSTSKFTLTFYYRNATEGEIMQKVMPDVAPGTMITLNVSDVNGQPNSNVDSLRITVRDKISSIGNMIAHSTSGSVSFKSPWANTEYGVYLYSLSNGADYAIIDQDTFATAGSQLVHNTRNMLVKLEDRDGQVCPDGVWFGSIGGCTGALDQLNNALQGMFGFRWGSISKVMSGRNFGAGAGDCNGNLGWHEPAADWIGVNYNKIGDNPVGLVSISLEEGFEIICDVDDLQCPLGTLGAILRAGGILGPRGRDYLLYTFIKDKLGDV